MSKLDELLRELCPNGVEHKRIGDFAMCFPGATPKTTHPEYWENGTIPWMSSGEVNQEEVTFTEKKITQKGYDATSTKMVPANTVVIALAGQGKTRGSVAITRISLCTNQSLCAIVTDETVLSEYLFHYMRSQYLKLRDLSAGNGTRGGLNMKMIESYLVPVPPVEIQSEIVGILNGFTNLLMELTAELTARKMQYSYYRDNLLSFNMPASKKKIGEITRVFSAARVHKNEWTQEGVPFYRSSDVISKFNGVENSRGKAYISFDLYKRLSAKSGKIMKDDILITGGGTIGIPYVVPSDEPIYVKDADLLCIQKSKEFNSRFLYHYFLSTEFRKYLENITHNATIAHYTISQIENTPVPLPPLDVQTRIVNVLDNFEKICSDLNIGLPAEIEARQKQYEYYRDKLLTFAENGNTILSRAEQSRAEQSRAEQSRAEQSRAEQSRALIKLLQYVFGYVRIFLGDVGSICMCKRILKSQTNTVRGVPFYKIGTFGKKADSYISQETFDEYRSKYNFPKKGDVLISAAGTIGRTVVYDGEPAYFQDSNIVWIDNDESMVLNRYLRYCYELKPWKASEGGTIPRLYNDNIAKAVIAVPPIEEQKRVVSILDRFDAICNDLTSGLPAEIEARQKQYEYYRDRLLSFKELN